MNIIDVKWFCGRTNVGIVRVQFEAVDEIRYFISAIEGFDPEYDKQFIAQWGSHFPTDAGDVLFGVKG